MCQPREVLVDIFQEYPEDTEHTYVPSCVVLSRCGGCCNDEAMECVPTETRNVMLQVSPRTDPSPQIYPVIELNRWKNGKKIDSHPKTILGLHASALLYTINTDNVVKDYNMLIVIYVRRLLI